MRTQKKLEIVPDAVLNDVVGGFGFGRIFQFLQKLKSCGPVKPESCQPPARPRRRRRCGRGGGEVEV